MPTGLKFYVTVAVIALIAFAVVARTPLAGPVLNG